MSFEELHDGSEGVFADLYLADIPHGIGKEIDIKDMKKYVILIYRRILDERYIK